MLEKHIKIEGMSCEHCVSSVEKLINEVDGVQSSEISLPNRAIVLFDESKTSVEDLKKVINDSEIYKVS